MIPRCMGIALLGALLVSGSPVFAQSAFDSGPATSTVVQGAPAPDADQALPLAASRMPPPASTRAYIHVFLAFAIAFTLLGGYVTLIGRQLARLEGEIREVSE